MSAPLVFLDTETTGVHPGRRVWEVAMIRREGEHEAETSFFVEVDLSFADPFGLQVGRFYERHPLGQYLARKTEWAPRPGQVRTDRQAAVTVARWTHGAHIVGAVPNFDTEVLAKLLRHHGLTPAWHYHLIDVENLAVGYLAGALSELRSQGVISAEDVDYGPPWDSDDLTTELQVTPASEEERHTALGDARWAQRMYDRVMGGRP